MRTQDVLISDFNNSQAKPSCTTPCQLCIRVTTITIFQTAANKVRQEMIKQGQCVCVCVCACACECACMCVYVRACVCLTAITIVLLIYSCMSLTDIHSGTLEYFLDEHIEKCSREIFLASYPSCEVVSAWYRLLPVS